VKRRYSREGRQTIGFGFTEGDRRLEGDDRAPNGTTVFGETDWEEAEAVEAGWEGDRASSPPMFTRLGFVRGRLTCLGEC
jgi:hypothetical protein